MANEKATVLIVEDNRLLRRSLCAFLAHTGYAVRSAEDGLAALAALRDGIPDILLSDLNMPRMSGFELLSVVRSEFPAIHVIAMSAAHSGSAIPPGVTAKAFYQKGTNVGELLKLMESARAHNADATL